MMERQVVIFSNGTVPLQQAVTDTAAQGLWIDNIIPLGEHENGTQAFVILAKALSNTERLVRI